MKRLTETRLPATRVAWMPYFILMATLLLTIVAARNVAVLTRAKNQARFDSAVVQTREQFQRMINGNLILLDGLRGLANSKLAIGKGQFNKYVESLELRRNYPGVQGLGFALVVTPGQRTTLLEKITKEESGFHVWPVSGRGQTSPIVFLAPSDGPNAAQIGYDLVAEPAGFGALENSAETGSPTASIQLATEQALGDQDRFGFILAAPVYYGGKLPELHDQRFTQLFGFVLCSFRIQDLFKTLSDSQLNSEIAFRIYDNAKTDAGTLLYDGFPDSARNPKNVPLTATRTLTLADRQWTINFNSLPEIKAAVLPLNPLITLIGSLISFLLFGITLVQARARTAAEQHAEDQQSNEARFRRLVEQSLVGIYVIQDGRLAYVNPKMGEIFGWSPEDMISRPISDFIAEESRSLAGENLARRLRGEVDSVHYHLLGLRKDGKVIDVEAHGGRVDYNGKPAILGSLMDVTEKRRIEEKSAWLASFPERNPQPIIELDLDSRVIHYSNPASRRLFPDLEDLALRHPFLAGLPGFTQPLLDGATEVVRREIAVGKSVYSQTFNYLPENQRLRVYGADITEQKQVEAQVALQRTELQIVLDTVPALIFYKDVDHRLVRVNQETVRLVGIPKETLEGKTDAELGSEYAEQYFRDEDEVMASGKAKRGIVEPMKTSSGTRWLQTDKIPYRDQTGKIVGIIGFAVDITERKRAEERVQAQLSRLDLFSRTTRAIAERQDLQSIFQVVVRSLEEHMPLDFCCLCLYDAAAEELVVSSIGVRSAALAAAVTMTENAHIAIDQNGLSHCIGGELIYEPDIASNAHAFPKRLARGGLRSMVAAPLIVESKVFGVLIAARHEAESFTSGQCEFLRQLSEHVALAANQAQLYCALQQAYDDLRLTQQAIMQQERLRALGQMASGIAHDINNAISPIALYTETLIEKEPNLSDRARNYLTTIQRAIDDVAATVARMQEFYRKREPQVTLTPTSLNRLAEEVLDLTRARWSDMAQQRGVTIEVRAELDSALPSVNGVESEIRDALTNLVINALDAMPDGGVLTVRTRVMPTLEGEDKSLAPARVCVEVADTGIGMDEETRRRCLEPFFTTKGERGTGLGLAMVYGMAQRHAAEIEVESAPGQGSTMRLIFPAPASSTTEAVRNLGSPAPASRLRILVVDDDPLISVSLGESLGRDGHVTVAADGGQAAIDAFLAAEHSGEPFAAVITDLGMPRVDGRKVAAAVKAASPSTLVILLTGWGQRLVAESDIPSDVDRVLSKPAKLRELREALAHCRKAQTPASSPLLL